MFIGMTVNKYFTEVSKHKCGTCGAIFTLCPPEPKADGWDNCLAGKCESYAPARDVDALFTKGANIVKVPSEKLN